MVYERAIPTNRSRPCPLAPCCQPSNEFRLFSIPTDTAAMARHYVLDAADLAIVGARRRASNRLGFAVQLCVLRDPGRVLDPTEVPPEPMLAFVARQIGADPALFGEYARRAETRREHLLELQRFLGLRSFGLDDWRACLRIGTDAAWATDRGEPIVQAMLAHLRANNILLPSAAVLERIGLAARVRARKKTFDALATGVTDAERDMLAGLLIVDPDLRRSRFAWLRDYSNHPRLRTLSRCWIASNTREGSESTRHAPGASTPPAWHA